MKQLLLLLCIIAPMGLMAQNENLAQDTTLYLNGRKPYKVLRREVRNGISFCCV